MMLRPGCKCGIVKSRGLVFILLALCTSSIAPISVVAQSGTQSIADRGKEVYDQNCLACHQIDGSGVPMLTPSLVNAGYVQGDKVRLINIVLKGLKGVEIDGEMYDNPMPPLAHLSDEDIAAVLTYVRSNFTNKAGPIKKEEVAAARKATN
jgi:mono/diheme cytochrome c family protein